MCVCVCLCVCVSVCLCVCVCVWCVCKWVSVKYSVYGCKLRGGLNWVWGCGCRGMCHASVYGVYVCECGCACVCVCVCVCVCLGGGVSVCLINSWLCLPSVQSWALSVFLYFFALFIKLITYISAPVLFKKPTPSQINLIKNAKNHF